MKVNQKKFPSKGERKIEINIEKFDTWSLDYSLALIILPALLQLKLTKHGIPSEFAEVGGEDWTSQNSFDFYKESHNEAFDEGCKRWEEVLDKMIWSFQQIAIEDYDDQYHHGKINLGWKKVPDKLFPNPVSGIQEPLYQMVDKNPDEHWYDHKGHMLHEERIQEGLDLFGKYYRSLWD
jgi:hypothetical protein